MRKTITTTILALTALMAVTACTSLTSGGESVTKQEVIETYASGVHALYSESLASAREMDQAISVFLADPNPSTLEAAKRSWLRARDDYGPTEAFRFYSGPIDDEDGPEGLINAWPLDEGYIDYVDRAPDTGIINMVSEYPTINAELLVSLNEEGGEENVSTGWHAIEFLLWGQDLNATGPGSRPVSDYTTAPQAERRATYLPRLPISWSATSKDSWTNGHRTLRRITEHRSSRRTKMWH